MPDVGSRTVAIHQVTEGKRSLREMRHPLAAELLVAEMAGELPADVAQAVRQHVAVCESCGSRASALAAPYQAIGSLNAQPVPFVPDLRREVRVRVGRVPAHVRAWQIIRQLGGGSLAAVFAIAALLLVAGLGVLTSALQTPPGMGRSQNGIASPLAAGAGADLYAQTAKVLDVRDRGGREWTVAEVIAVDERTGSVVRSLPTDGSALRVARADEAPVSTALTNNGATVFELTRVRDSRQAVVAIDTRSGAIRWITALALPDGRQLVAGVQARTVVVAPDGRNVYISVIDVNALDSGPRVLALDAATGHVIAALAPRMPASAPLPPDGPVLPDVSPPPPAQFTPALGSRVAFAGNGVIAVSPDGSWIFDVTTFIDSVGQQTAVVRRFSAITGDTAQTQALRGDFRLATLAASSNAAVPMLYLATGGSAGQAYVLSADVKGPTLIGQIPLGGPLAPPNTLFAGQISISPTSDGRRAYISADASAGNGSIAAHDIWLMDSGTTTVASHRVPFAGAGQVRANWAGGANGQIFDLLDGQVYLLEDSLVTPTDPQVWLRVADGQPIVHLLGTGPA